MLCISDDEIEKVFCSYSVIQSTSYSFTCPARGGLPCDVLTCRCDKAAVECFARSHFNRRYRNFNRKRYCKKEDD
ncbi:unnamed protein product [Lampetra planeri]